MIHVDLRGVDYTEDPGFVQISGWLDRQEIQVLSRSEGGW